MFTCSIKRSAGVEMNHRSQNKYTTCVKLIYTVHIMTETLHYSFSPLGKSCWIIVIKRYARVLKLSPSTIRYLRYLVNLSPVCESALINSRIFNIQVKLTLLACLISLLISNRDAKLFSPFTLCTSKLRYLPVNMFLANFTNFICLKIIVFLTLWQNWTLVITTGWKSIKQNLKN